MKPIYTNYRQTRRHIWSSQSYVHKTHSPSR